MILWKSSSFNKIKSEGRPKKTKTIDRILNNGKTKKVSAMNIWLREIKKIRDEKNKKIGGYMELAKRLKKSFDGSFRSSF